MMWKHLRTQREKCSGFTLIEALIAVALMGVILAALTSITSQWLPSWNRGIARAQRSELVRIALDQLIADLGVSEFITPNRDTKTPLFDGTEFSVTFVRTAIGPNARPGLEIVRIAAIPNKGDQSWSEQRSHLPRLARTQLCFPIRTLPTRSFFYDRHIWSRSPMRDATEFGKRPGKMPTNCRPPFA